MSSVALIYSDYCYLMKSMVIYAVQIECKTALSVWKSVWIVSAVIHLTELYLIKPIMSPINVLLDPGMF